MIDPTTALTTAIENSTKVGNTPLFATVIDRLLGFKISEWKAQGDAIKRQIADGYEEAKQKGIGIQYVSAFRANANLINVSAKAARYIGLGVENNIDIDNDVFWGLIEHSKAISNDEVQELIAKIIAGEYNVPGTYSMSTLQTIKMLGKNELELFERICSLLMENVGIPRRVFNPDYSAKEILTKLKINYGDLQILQSLGIFFPNEMTRSLHNPEKKNLQLLYFGMVLNFIPENADYQTILIPSFYDLSPVGKQIVGHLNPSPNEEYLQWLKENYEIQNYKLAD